MYHYMAAMHQRFFRAPDFAELGEEIEQARQEVRDCLGQPERRKLMQLVDAQNLLREEISLPSCGRPGRAGYLSSTTWSWQQA